MCTGMKFPLQEYSFWLLFWLPFHLRRTQTTLLDIVDVNISGMTYGNQVKSNLIGHIHMVSRC